MQKGIEENKNTTESLNNKAKKAVSVAIRQAEGDINEMRSY